MDLPFFDTIYTRAGLTERSGSTLGGEVPAIFVGGTMKELSIISNDSPFIPEFDISFFLQKGYPD